MGPQYTIFSIDKHIAVEPFKNDARAPESKAGLVFASRHRVVPLVVVFGPGDLKTLFQPGAVVWLRASDAESPWAKEVFDVAGHSIILIPESRVIAVQPYPPNPESKTEAPTTSFTMMTKPGLR
jgi:hypothetical protein